MSYLCVDAVPTRMVRHPDMMPGDQQIEERQPPREAGETLTQPRIKEIVDKVVVALRANVEAQVQRAVTRPINADSSEVRTQAD